MLISPTSRHSHSFHAALAASLVVIGITTSCRAQPVAPDVLLSTRADPAAAAISPLLRGSQFNFFNGPIKERRNNEALLGEWKNARVSALRYPGGTWGDHYVWDHPENSYFVANATAKTIITPAEFIAMCRKIGAEPIFQANALVRGKAANNWINPTKIENIREGAHWTAEWVRQANEINGWNVKYWEIGNELWIMYRPQEYATALTEYSKAMKAVDPSIKIIACGLSSAVGPFKLEWFNFKDDPNWKPRLANSNDAASWNKALFTLAQGHFDYIAPHPYIDVKGLQDSRQIYLQSTVQIWEQAGLKSQYEFLRQYQSPAKVAVTEWATNFSYSVSAQGGLKLPMYFYSQANGVNAAHYMGQIVSGEPNEIAVLHSLDEVQTLWFWPKKAMSDKPLPHPIYLAYKLWNTHLGTRRAISTVTKQPTLKIGDKSYPATFTCASEDEKNVYLMAINLDPDAPHRFQWQPQDVRTAGRGVLSLMAGPALDADNWATWNQDAHIVDIRDSDIVANTGTFSFELPAYSVAGITVARVP
ncbi:MAG: hypothetical protein M3347_02080 [Armatimonadota bacterium]|nr:hypothetical protein [Armatimonadota bacterium]